MARKAPRSWGYWTEGKLDILTRYLDRFTTATKNKANARIYLDAFAGEGHGTSRTTGVQFEGSARIGLKVSDPPFDRCYFFELGEKAAELERELTRDFPGRYIRVVPRRLQRDDTRHSCRPTQGRSRLGAHLRVPGPGRDGAALGDDQGACRP